MTDKKDSPNSAEIVAQLDASRKRGQGKVLPSIPDRFGCLDATHFRGNRAVRLIRGD